MTHVYHMNHLLRLVPLTILFVFIGISDHKANAGSVTIQSVDQDVALNRAMSKVPAGKTVTDSSCQESQAGGIGGETHYRCTVSWD